MDDIIKNGLPAIASVPDPHRAKPELFENEQGAIGYIVMWLLGVPASLLFVIFLLRGCN